MPIDIAFDGVNVSITSSFDRYKEPVILSENEKYALKIIEKAFIDSGIDFDSIHLERRTNNYLTIVSSSDNDFCRIKIGLRSKWISLDLHLCDDAIKNDKRLSDVENKNQIHWKIPLKTIEDLQNYSDIIVASFKSTIKHNNGVSDKVDVPIDLVLNPGEQMKFSLLKPNGELFVLNSDEIEFTLCVEEAVRREGILSPIVINYRSENILNFMINSAQIGRIKLRGKKFTIQVITKSTCKLYLIQNLDEAKTYIKKWVKYCKSLVS